ncbi:hypothetical protein FF38_14267 [Lucilia cuprina]|uniref:Uncharacterized protein n=1 Tax=Lucilia cuprina TaxID=7375 RepID=A0A0L0BXH9_LUCCU|nr:hypothetical protein FF38_14267 [Lucilia cuprina]
MFVPNYTAIDASVKAQEDVSNIAPRSNSSIASLPILRDAMERSLTKRFDKYFELSSKVDLAITASVLCPDVKLNWIKALNPEISQLEIENIDKRIKTKIDNEITEDFSAISQPTNSYFNFGFQELGS